MLRRSLALRASAAFSSSSFDPYAVLGLPQTADQAQIKAKYHALAMQFHPDRTGGSDVRFKEISKAYEMLRSGTYTPDSARAQQSAREGAWARQEAYTRHQSAESQYARQRAYDSQSGFRVDDEFLYNRARAARRQQTPFRRPQFRPSAGFYTYAPPESFLWFLLKLFVQFYILFLLFSLIFRVPLMRQDPMYGRYARVDRVRTRGDEESGDDYLHHP
eukprot:RCo000130